MSTPRDAEDFFRAVLDADPADAAARLLLAEWLDERGDSRAAGYRWMARRRKHPYFLSGSERWSWTNLRNAVPVHNQLPPRLYEALPRQIDTDWKKYETVREAEEELASEIARNPRLIT